MENKKKQSKAAIAAEIENLNILKARLDAAQIMTGLKDTYNVPFFTKNFIMKNILLMTETQIAEASR